MSASTRTAQQPLGIQFGAILAIVALAMVAALAFAVSTSGTLKPAGAPAPAAAVGPDHADLPDVGHGTGVAIPTKDGGVWAPDGRGGVMWIPFNAAKQYTPPPGYWKYNGRGGVEYVETPGYAADQGLAPRTDDTPVIHGTRVNPE